VFKQPRHPRGVCFYSQLILNFNLYNDQIQAKLDLINYICHDVYKEKNPHMKLLPNLRTMSKKKKALLILLIIAIAGGGYWFYRSKTTKKTRYTTETMKKSTLTNSLTLSGTVELSNLISVATKASGVVNKVYVTDGQTVKAGDKLAEITLDSEGKNNQADAYASYLQAKNSVNSANASLYTQQASMLEKWQKYIDKTNEDNYEDPNSEYRTLTNFVITQDEWLASEANYKNQQSAITTSQASLSQASYNYKLYQSTITAPVSGTVVGLNLAEGLTISYSESSSGGAGSQTVATIKTSGKPVASFNVTEVDIAKLKVGQTATMTIDSLTGKSFTGKIVAVDRVGSVSSSVTQYPVLIAFDEDDASILTNMAVSAVIVFESKENALSVTSSAISTGRDGSSMVRVLNNGKVEYKTVQTGITTDTATEITSGVNEGDVVITGTTTSSSSSSSSSSTKSSQGGFGMMEMGGGGAPPGGGSVKGMTTRSR
jgi:RND family efflux transporter MFP subunit